MAMGRRGQGRGRRHYQWPFYDFLRAVCRWFSASIATMTMLHATCSNTLGPPLKWLDLHSRRRINADSF